MTDLLLDTNVISEIRKPKDRIDAKVAHWSKTVDFAACRLSVISLLEIQRGILSIARRDAEQGSALLKWLEQEIMPDFRGRIIPIDSVVAIRAAELQAPDPRPLADALIAATSLIHNLTVVTRNVDNFLPCGVRVINPWESEDVLVMVTGEKNLGNRPTKSG
jgi:predicted nucleic acid-binding protein